MSGQNDFGADEIEFQCAASEIDVAEFWVRLQQVIWPGESVSRKVLLKVFGRRRVWIYMAELERNGFVKISVVSGEVAINETMRGKKYLP
jgi:hypothetical protein